VLKHVHEKEVAVAEIMNGAGEGEKEGGDPETEGPGLEPVDGRAETVPASQRAHPQPIEEKEDPQTDRDARVNAPALDHRGSRIMKGMGRANSRQDVPVSSRPAAPEVAG